MGSEGSASNHRFGRFVLQPTERRLLGEGVAVQLGPRAFDVLVVLVESAGHLVTKDRLLSMVWPQVVVEENALQAQISALRKVLGREAIATVSGRGYRFTLPVVADAASDVPDAAVRARSSRLLPQPLTSFVGREKELVELSRLLRQTRLLTLTGAGGCGKTRLSLQLAVGLESMFAEGVWLVELAALTDPATLPQAVASVLALQASPAASPTQLIADHIGPRQALLVLDNAEHLLEAGARLADALLRHCPRLSILVTSRASLGITGELTFRVPSLSVPEAGRESSPERVLQFESVRLFAERARLQRPHFAVTEQNALAVASLCRRLDGIPLAIELAAARLRAMTPEEIDRRLDRRFSLLTDGSRTALPRHRTLQSLIDWSYDLLDVAEKVLFCRVAVFADGWRLEAAESVCASDAAERLETLDRLASLVDKSLVTADEQQGVTRYWLLETMRQYGLDRLRDSGEEAAWRSRHLDYFTALAKEAERHLQGGEQRAWLDRLDTEHDNMRGALSWAGAGGDVSAGLRLSTSIFHFWWTRGYVDEGGAFVRQLLSVSPGTVDPATRGRALAAAGQFAMLQGDYVAAMTVQDEALAIYTQLGNRNAIASLLSSMGTALDEQGDFDRARAMREQALAIYRESDLSAAVATTLNNLGWSARNHGRLDEAKAFLEESLAVSRALGDASGLADVLLNLAGVALDRRDMDVARQFGEESLGIYRGLRARRGIASALLHLGLLACAMSEWNAARVRLEEGLAIVIDLNDQSGVAQSLDGLALSHQAGDPERAARIWGAVERLRGGMGFKLSAASQSIHDRRVAAVRAALGDDSAFDRAWRDGQGMSSKEATRYALLGSRDE